MEEKKPRIGDGTACFLVCDKSLATDEAEFYKWLHSEGFSDWGHHAYWDCPWVYVNLKSKLYALGMPGIPITYAIGEHAITVSEFRTIYEILKKYEGKDVFVFHSERFDYDR